MQSTTKIRNPGPLRFLRGFLRRPLAVGAVTPSSSWLAAKIVEGLALEEAETVVELGPGTGAFTGAILDKIGDQTTFFALEVSREFSDIVSRQFPTAKIYNDSAEHLATYLRRHNKVAADHVVCGLPWASLPLEVQDKIFKAILASLPPGGIFSTFGYVHARKLPNAVKFRRRLEEHFAEVERTRTVWKNFPPAFVYRCVR